MLLIEGYKFQKEYYYHKEHSWAKIEPNGNIRVGLNDFYQNSAGDISNIDLPFEGDKVYQGKMCGRIESDKWLGKFIAPLSGEVIHSNIDLEINPTLINKSPYEKGWIILIKPSNLDKELKNLFKVENLKEWLKKEMQKAEEKKK